MKKTISIVPTIIALFIVGILPFISKMNEVLKSTITAYTLFGLAGYSFLLVFLYCMQNAYQAKNKLNRNEKLYVGYFVILLIGLTLFGLTSMFYQ
ncbi:LasU family protein [Furfurilactobacillus milii]|uniref:LasU family protein n=1 Tax=Furfurilactobacillus milii TaxID=2888272 RepID=A0ABT6D8T7_9LACO|nr:LasU family protein [Furfurilactobacillus milii]QLE67297.1 hypothetical protein LROSL2_1947 [Furfurilactobacillus rossiae]MCF6161013.1 hypothetical protein [Furfurilactobacillus milii]MCF6163497.1 hypothetical protein [Furfurilactobacillus milii]MCF6418702.1 hypothetical protein [Furfurilactobacillus milii]MDF9913545.1 LasU family protein [Furfurilactobacillus milii]